MNGKEDYATLKESLVNVVKDVNNLIEKGYILVVEDRSSWSFTSEVIIR